MYALMCCFMYVWGCMCVCMLVCVVCVCVCVCMCVCMFVCMYNCIHRTQVVGEKARKEATAIYKNSPWARRQDAPPKKKCDSPTQQKRCKKKLIKHIYCLKATLQTLCYAMLCYVLFNQNRSKIYENIFAFLIEFIDQSNTGLRPTRWCCGGVPRSVFNPQQHSRECCRGVSK